MSDYIQKKDVRTLGQKIRRLINNEIWLIGEYGRSSGKIVGFFKLLKFRLHTVLIHEPTMLYYSIRNYTISNTVRDQNFWLMWELRKPLTLTYAFKTTDNYCPSCKKLNAKEERDQYAPETLYHAEFTKYYERPIWSFNFKYYYTACTCEYLLFEPLETWYNTGGLEGSGSFTRPDAQWDINEELGWDSNPMKRHKKQLLPDDWRKNE